MTTKEQYAVLHPALNELQWRMYLGTEAARIGYGGISSVARASGADRKTIRKGMREMTQVFSKTRVREVGGGRKKSTQKDGTLRADLESLLEPKGDPMSLVQWTTQSLATLVKALTEKKHTIKKSALAEILAGLGFSLKANKKNIEGVSHPDRDQQFQFIKKSCARFERQGSPIISVDCKKKELIGNFKNQGRTWQPKGKNTIVNVYDFKSLSSGRACPYGVYDIIRNTGLVNVGVDHDTAAFAVESIRRWWRTIGQALYPGQTELLITSDGGGSNGVKNRLWKKELQAFADETGLAVTVAHLPPAASKWNKIEHRLFSYISIHWKGKPLVSLETIIELLSHTTTTQGLTVVALVDQNIYPLGVKVTDAEMEKLNLLRNEFHGDWNYTINPRNG